MIDKIFRGLTKLGFEPDAYILCDDADGNGPYIKEWLSDQPQPSEADITTAHNEWQVEYDSQEYARNRAEQYPDLAEQLDLLWDAIDTDTLNDKDYRNKFYTRLKKVKEDNPKG